MDLTSSIMDMALREVLASRRVRAEVTTFEEWVAKKKFKNPKTKQDVTFDSLEKSNPDAAKKIRDEYNKAVGDHGEKKDKFDQDMPIKKQWNESKDAWKKRVKQSEEDIDKFTDEQFDQVFSEKVNQALTEALKDEPVLLKNLSELKSGTPISEMDPPNVKMLKQVLDKAVQKFPKESVTEYHKIFGNKTPQGHVAEHIGNTKKKQARVEKINEEMEGETDSDKIAKLEAEAGQLMGEMEDHDAKVQEALGFMKTNGPLVSIKTQHKAVIDAASKRHTDKVKENKPTPVEVEEDAPPTKKGLKKYTKSRDYSDDELEEESGEFFDNLHTMSKAPGAFKDVADFKAKVKAAKPMHLSKEDLEKMTNTDVADVLKAKDPKAHAKGLAKEYGKDWDRIEKGMKDEVDLPPPIVLRDKKGNLHLMAGNTRLMSAVAMGHSLPTKVVDFDGDFEEDKKPGDVWGKKPKLYSMNSEEEYGGPFKGMNEAKRFSQGKEHTPEEKAQSDKTKKEQADAKKRKKKGSDEMVIKLAGFYLLSA